MMFRQRAFQQRSRSLWSGQAFARRMRPRYFKNKNSSSSRWIAGSLVCVLFGNGACGGPRTPLNPTQDEGSAPESSQFVVSATLTGLAMVVLKEVSKASISWAWEDVLTKTFADKKTGDTARKEASEVLRIFKAQIDEKKLEDIQIKMNSLENTLVHGYVRGLPESATQLALLSDKVNDLLATFEFWMDSSDPFQKSMALAHLASYAYLSTVKVYLFKERYLASEKDKQISQDTLTRLRELGKETSKKAAAYLERAVGPVAEEFIRTQKITTTYREYFEREDFDLRQGLRYQYCAEALADGSFGAILKDPTVCGPKSSLKCSNELDESCLKKAKEEAKQLFDGQNLQQNLIQDVKNHLWRGEIEGVIKALKDVAF